MGESIAEGTITTWLKAVGDRVERDEPLFEISTDKVDAEIPAPESGILLEIRAEAGQTVEINAVVAVIGAEGESVGVSSEAPVKAEAKAEAPSGKAPEAKPDTARESLEERRRTKSSPVVRKIASEHGVDISALSGSGVSGRVTKRDILAHLESGAPAATGATSVAPAASGAMPGVPMELPAAFRGRVMEGDTVEEMTTMRKKIAEHMVISKHVSPHVATVWEVDFSNVADLRKKYKGVWKQRHGVNLTFTSFILKVTVDALKAFPGLNASLDGDRIIYHRSVNLGIAVALDWGLLVPVIAGADELNLLGLTRRANDLADRARVKKLKPQEVQDGTFTITNPGVFGPMFGLPVINQPQVAILGVGAVEKRPVVIDDMLGIRTRAYMSMSFDHRLVDGADADAFMKKIKVGIEQFDESELG
jgi:2-oxoglutarate dehydrogenase E2 component (dihydrolipoamide succinyltransferase)